MTTIFDNWKKSADCHDLKLLSKIIELFGNHQHLIMMIFNSKKPELNDTSSNIKKNALSLSHGEYLLTLLALDIWDGSGDVNLKEIFKVFDNKTIINIFKAFMN